jgi:hypothetical protein
MERISNIKDTNDEIDLIKLKLFHFTSILFLSVFSSSKEILSRLVLSNNSFKGMFPIIVTIKAPTPYMIKADINIQKILFGYKLK